MAIEDGSPDGKRNQATSFMGESHLADASGDAGSFTMRYCRGCSVVFCDRCVDLEAHLLYPRMTQMEARAKFFGLCKRAWQLNKQMLDIGEPERWPLHVPIASAQEICEVRDNRIRSLIFALRGQAGHQDEEDFGEEDEDECCNWCHVPLTPWHCVLECHLCGDGEPFCHSVCLREHILSAHAGSFTASLGESPSESVPHVDSLVRQAKKAGRQRTKDFKKLVVQTWKKGALSRTDAAELTDSEWMEDARAWDEAHFMLSDQEMDEVREQWMRNCTYKAAQRWMRMRTWFEKGEMQDYFEAVEMEAVVGDIMIP